MVTSVKERVEQKVLPRPVPVPPRPTWARWPWLVAALVVATAGFVAFFLWNDARQPDVTPVVEGQVALNAQVDATHTAWVDDDVAALQDIYADDAVFVDVDGNRFTGAGAIAGRAHFLDTFGFAITRTGDTVRYGDVAVTPIEYGRLGEDVGRGVAVMQYAGPEIVWHQVVNLQPAGTLARPWAADLTVRASGFAMARPWSVIPADLSAPQTVARPWSVIPPELSAQEAARGTVARPWSDIPADLVQPEPEARPWAR